MGIYSTFQTGVSGLKAQGEAVGVAGDNIANSTTVGFKASRPEFQDVLAKNLKGILGGNQMGRGVRLAAINPILSQGNIESTERVTDLAINGDGYFILHGQSDGVSYSRDGSFSFDKLGYLVNNDGLRVQGFEADEKGTIQNKREHIKFPQALVPAQPTGKVNLDLNLDSRIQTYNKKFDILDPYNSSHFASGVEVYDSQGVKHLVSLFFNKVADSVWEYRGIVDGAEITGGQKGKLVEVELGRLTFNQDGLLLKEEKLKSAYNFNGGAKQNQQIKIDFGESIITDGGTGMNATKQYGKASDIISWNQNGQAAGTITNLSFSDEGILTAIYSNGETKDLYQIAMAKFEAPEKLFKIGQNRYKEARESGPPAIGKPKHNGRGNIYAKSLERSNVDLASEFVNLITHQRAFQANVKTVTTADEMLAEVLTIKR